MKIAKKYQKYDKNIKESSMTNRRSHNNRVKNPMKYLMKIEARLENFLLFHIIIAAASSTCVNCH